MNRAQTNKNKCIELLLLQIEHCNFVADGADQRIAIRCKHNIATFVYRSHQIRKLQNKRVDTHTHTHTYFVSEKRTTKGIPLIVAKRIANHFVKSL